MKRLIPLVILVTFLILPVSVSAEWSFAPSYYDTVLTLSIPDSNGVLSGKITDYSNIPLQDVLVTISTRVNDDSITFETTTDADGTYGFYDLPYSINGLYCFYSFTATLEGYCVSYKNISPLPKNKFNIKLCKEAYFSVEAPVIFTSIGQSDGIYLADTICDKAGIKHDLADAPAAKHLDSGVGLTTYDSKTDLPVYYVKKSDMPNGTKYKALVLVMGTFPAMPNPIYPLDSDILRTLEIILWARMNNIPIIGMHLEGHFLRGVNDGNTFIIETIAPLCDMIVVLAESNYDDKFTTIAQKYDIPITVAPTASALEDIFQNIFIE